jgi:hypothetical protein
LGGFVVHAPLIAKIGHYRKRKIRLSRLKRAP